jgi:hypothetical protein
MWVGAGSRIVIPLYHRIRFWFLAHICKIHNSGRHECSMYLHHHIIRYIKLLNAITICLRNLKFAFNKLDPSILVCSSRVLYFISIDECFVLTTANTRHSVILFSLLCYELHQLVLSYSNFDSATCLKPLQQCVLSNCWLWCPSRLLGGLWRPLQHSTYCLMLCMFKSVSDFKVAEHSYFRGSWFFFSSKSCSWFSDGNNIVPQHLYELFTT